jgi:DNA-binding CsgD family transcriptional regulator
MLESFRFCHLRLSFWIADKTGLDGRENLIFMVFCSAIVAGMILLSAILAWLNIYENSRRTVLVLRVLAAVTVLGTLLGHFTESVGALVSQFLAMAAMAGMMNICLNQAAKGGVVQERIGRFVGFYVSVAGFFTILLFFLPNFPMPHGVILVTVCLFPVVAAVVFKAQEPEDSADQNDFTERKHAPVPREIKRRAICVIGLFVITAGILDNIFFFESAFEEIPHFMFFTITYGCLTVIAAGYVCDKFKWAAVTAVSLLLICLGQSMSYFSENRLLVYPYAIFTNAGNVSLEILLTALPVIYSAREGGGKFHIVPGLGYAGLYGGFLVASVAFEFVPEMLYKAALGVALILSLANVYMVLTLDADYVRFLYERTLANAKNPGVADYKSELGFTGKECEVMGLLVSGMTTGEIAQRMFISERTVNFHIGSMLRKTSSKNRVELIAKTKNKSS